MLTNRQTNTALQQLAGMPIDTNEVAAICDNAIGLVQHLLSKITDQNGCDRSNQFS